MMMKTGMCVVCAALVYGAVQAGQTDLRSLTAVYVDKDAPKAEQEAAGNLARYLGRATGTAIAVNPADRPYSPSATNAVFLGARLALESGLLKQSDLDKLVWDGFAIGIGGGRAAIAGNRGTSVNNGVVELLQRVGYVFSEWNREALDPEPKLVFDDGVIARSPAFEFRSGWSFWFHRTTPGLRGNPRQALDPGLFTNSTVDATHTANYLVPKQLYREKHPEYYSMDLNGERKLYSEADAYTHLCLSNPDVQRIAVERVTAWVKMQPEPIYFGVSHGDGHDWCQCPQCKAHDAVTGNYSDRMLKLLVNPVARAVAKVRPDAKLVMLAYCGTDEPPARERPEPNVVVMYCPYFGIALSMAHPLTHPLNAEALRQFEGWRAAASGNMMIYDYNMYFTPSWEAWTEKVKWFHARGVRTGAVMCGMPTHFRWLFAYLNEQAQWDPALDVRRARRRYLRAIYGRAAPHLEDYFGVVRERLAKGYAIGIHGGSWTGYFGDGAIGRMLGAFDRALAAVAGDERLTRELRAERQMVVDTYLGNAVDAAILSGEKRPPARADRAGKSGRLDWRITNADRRTARGLVAQRLRAALDTLADQAAVLADDAKKGAHAKAAKDAQGAVQRLRGTLERFGPMTIPEKVSVPEAARLYLEDPEGAVARYPRQTPPAATAEPLPGGNGVLLPAAIFRDAYGPMFYSWYCKPGRNTAIVYAPRSPRPSVMRVSFTLEKAPAGGATLDMEGQDSQNDLLPPAQIRITLNGAVVHEGDCGFVKRGWSRRAFAVPAGVLKAGENMIEIRNVYEGTARLDGWWFALSEAKLTFE